MNRFTPRRGTGLPSWQHFIYMQDAAQKTFRDAYSDYLELADSFFVSGVAITQSAVGSGTSYTVTEGVVCLRGEFLPVEAHSILKTASQVVYFEVRDVGEDTTPAGNQDGVTDHVLRKRTARLGVASVEPSVWMPVNAPRKYELDRLRLKGRIIPKGGIVPYYGSMAVFESDGLGKVNTPMEGYAICNGNNGTIDLRGLVPFGATSVPDVGAPSLYEGVTPSTSPGDRVGADQVQILADHLPAHTHPYTFKQVGGVGGDVSGDTGGYQRTTEPGTTGPNVTEADKLDVRQAGRALVFIQSIV